MHAHIGSETILPQAFAIGSDLLLLMQPWCLTSSRLPAAASFLNGGRCRIRPERAALFGALQPPSPARSPLTRAVLLMLGAIYRPGSCHAQTQLATEPNIRMAAHVVFAHPVFQFHLYSNFWEAKFGAKSEDDAIGVGTHMETADDHTFQIPGLVNGFKVVFHLS